ncbi:chaperone protein dnaJ 11, chloroplastic-like [Zingiber officinale]|uniref:chaperone protein dnaJ 11, chloroplastic-like n=1 Tax=Zingiber officinale TaxID=94328 RepID=UPI001C4B112C|nr:chaperone protein dnaJ 11, chloroplastic-like [Zingiber officinale]
MAHALFSFPTHFLASPRAHAASRPSFVGSAGAAAAAASPASLYEVLGVPANATNCEIKASYRRLALECHPDVGAPAEEFLRLHAAYATLADPDKRADYDRQRMAPDQHLLRRRYTYESTSSSMSRGNCRRTWETDQCW